jgi:DNA-binding beta-propeller fold protein YncE
MKKKLLLLLFYFTAVILSACNNAEKNYTSPGGYDLANPEKKPLAESLLEISGICFVPHSNDTVYCVNDEEGMLFKLNLLKENTAVTKYKFAKNGDYEDLAFFHKKWIVLKSNGTLNAFSPVNIGIKDSLVVTSDVLPVGEYEAMAAVGDTLYVLCKSCPADDEKGSISAYAITENGGSFKMVRTVSISLNGITKEKAFKPSGMALNPVTGNWFIISAVNKKLVELNRQFGFIGTHHLKGTVFKQPEGIAFDSTGTLYISNEGDEEKANLLVFRYKP